MAFPATGPSPLTVAGHLRVPSSGAPPYAAVVIVHGSAGLDSRGGFYAAALMDAGIATLEIDLWAARGWYGGLTGRPKGVAETLPDVYGALAFLAGVPAIDAARVGIMGFSWGGVMSMLSATSPYADALGPPGLRFAAHAPLYPVCWAYNRVPGCDFAAFTGAPVLIQAGADDAYDSPTSAPDLVAALPAAARGFISAVVHPGATHAWDRLEPAVTVTDPMAHLGRGGDVAFEPNPPVASRSRQAAVAFFARHLRGDADLAEGGRPSA